MIIYYLLYMFKYKHKYIKYKNKYMKLKNKTGSSNFEKFQLDSENMGFIWTNDTPLQEAVDIYLGDDAYRIQKVIERFGEIHNWDVSEITDMEALFKNKTNFNFDISNWDVSNVTNMSEMFSGCIEFNLLVGSSTEEKLKS